MRIRGGPLCNWNTEQLNTLRKAVEHFHYIFNGVLGGGQTAFGFICIIVLCLQHSIAVSFVSSHMHSNPGHLCCLRFDNCRCIWEINTSWQIRNSKHLQIIGLKFNLNFSGPSEINVWQQRQEQLWFQSRQLEGPRLLNLTKWHFALRKLSNSSCWLWHSFQFRPSFLFLGF